ncbi:hypothetical protein L596_023098 [Steinernema carpocapsae]|uniref:Uncharacterized protein n=1 Tax=Steinernema carpocapsae TaxID=34508 RepID=A0A4U5MCM1_STECR|nr:hypothetical protein L596_023098 [Steinernema carpocapsae]
MDSVPFLFKQDVKALTFQDEKYPVVWNIDYKVDKPMKTRFCLYLQVFDGHCRYKLTTKTRNEVDPTSVNWSESEIHTIIVYDHDEREFQELTPKILSIFEHVFSKSQNLLNFLCAFLAPKNAESCLKVNRLLRAVPRFRFIWIIGCKHLDEVTVNAMREQRVQTVQTGRIRITKEAFACIQEFTKNCNFKEINVRVHKNSEVSCKTICKWLKKRVEVLKKEGKNAEFTTGKRPFWFWQKKGLDYCQYYAKDQLSVLIKS